MSSEKVHIYWQRSIHNYYKLEIWRLVDVHPWFMVCRIGMGYGIWESLAHLAGNQLGGHEKVWVMGVYGLSQVWIKTEVTVYLLE